MDQMQDAMRPRRWILYTFVGVFLLFWCLTLIAVVTAGACRHSATEPGKRLVYCNISVVAGAPVRAIDVAGHGGLIHADRALVHAMLGDDFAARADMGRALYLTEGTQFRETLARRIADARGDPAMHVALDRLGLLQDFN